MTHSLLKKACCKLTVLRVVHGLAEKLRCADATAAREWSKESLQRYKLKLTAICRACEGKKHLIPKLRAELKEEVSQYRVGATFDNPKQRMLHYFDVETEVNAAFAEEEAEELSPDDLLKLVLQRLEKLSA